jgi:transglutaminase-like putative cysteine protease
MKYDKPEGGAWGRGDAVWACDSKYGNCTDFHSVFIGACRDLKIPAKFEMGFPIPDKRGAGEVAGYHCWAKFLDEGSSKWVAVDISEADRHPKMKEYYFGNLTADRVTFTTGRDLELSPAPAAGPVNFLIYPYVEVDGKPHTKFIKRFKYADIE